MIEEPDYGATLEVTLESNGITAMVLLLELATTGASEVLAHPLMNAMAMQRHIIEEYLKTSMVRFPW